MTYTVQGKPSIFPPCAYCGARYEAHEEIGLIGERGHRINMPSQPQHGYYHAFTPMPPNAHGLCEKDSDVDTSNWPSSWIDVKDTEPPKHVPIICCDKSGFMFVATYDGSEYQSNCTFNYVTHWMLAPSLPKSRKVTALLKKLYESMTEDKDIDVCGFPVCLVHLERIHDTETGEVTEIHLKVMPR